MNQTTAHKPDRDPAAVLDMIHRAIAEGWTITPLEDSPEFGDDPEWYPGLVYSHGRTIYVSRLMPPDELAAELARMLGLLDGVRAEILAAHQAEMGLRVLDGGRDPSAGDMPLPLPLWLATVDGGRL